MSVPRSASGELSWILMFDGLTEVSITAIPAAFPDGSFTATPRTGPVGTCGRVLPWPMGLGSVLESWNWKIPPGGTLVFKTAIPIAPAGNGAGVGVAVGTGVGSRSRSAGTCASAAAAPTGANSHSQYGNPQLFHPHRPFLSLLDHLQLPGRAGLVPANNSSSQRTMWPDTRPPLGAISIPIKGYLRF